jgi:hypothetical protein
MTSNFRASAACPAVLREETTVEERTGQYLKAVNNFLISKPVSQFSHFRLLRKLHFRFLPFLSHENLLC